MATWLDDGFSRILELRFLKVRIRISLSNCWTQTSFVFLDFLFVLHNSTPSTHLMAVFTIYHTGGQNSSRGLIGQFGIHSGTCIKRSVVKFPNIFPLKHYHIHHFSAVVLIKRLLSSLTESYRPVQVVWYGHLERNHSNKKTNSL